MEKATRLKQTINQKKIRAFEASKMRGLGTPEDLNHYLVNHKSINK